MITVSTPIAMELATAVSAPCSTPPATPSWPGRPVPPAPPGRPVRRRVRGGGRSGPVRRSAPDPRSTAMSTLGEAYERLHNARPCVT